MKPLLPYALVSLCSSLVAPCQVAPTDPSAGIRRLAFAPDGRLAFATGGDIWLLEKPGGGGWTDARPLAAGAICRQVTHGLADDRDPVWTHDGGALVFASDRSGGFDLYRVPVDRGQAGVVGVGAVVRLTTSADADGEPSVGPDGSIVFVRGRGPSARLYLRRSDGGEEALTDPDRSVRSPALSPDGTRVAYVSRTGRQSELRVLVLERGRPNGHGDPAEADGVAEKVGKDDRSRRETVAGAAEGPRDRVVASGARAEFPAWSPDGSRIAFTTRGSQPGVWLTDSGGSYQNLLSTARARAAWVPGGELVALAALPRADAGYNGDPDRVGERRYDAMCAADRVLRFIAAPPPPDAPGSGASVVSVAIPVDPERNAAAFERVFDRQLLLYGREDANESWGALRHEHLPKAAAAKSKEELDAAIWAMLRERPPLRREARGRAVVSSAHAIATAAGVEMLDKGGNVVDAAIAVSFALGVVEPDASGVGGYGEMMVHLAGMEEPVCLEFMTRVPAAALAESAAGERRAGGGAGARRPSTAAGRRGGAAAVNVPGVVAGMRLAFERYGSGELEWQELVQPAIVAARQGFLVDDALATTLARNAARYRESTGARALFLRDGKPLRAGDRLVNEDFAWTLEQIAEHGAEAFYEGEVARRMVADLRAHGSVMTGADLAHYYAVERAAVRGTYRGFTVYSGAPPVSGGASVVGRLTTLDQAGSLRSYRDDPATLHRMIEAWKLAPSTAGRIADPGLWSVDLAPFADQEAAARRWRRAFDPERSLTPDGIERLRADKVAAAGGVPGVLDAATSTGTTAFVVADSAGNMVSVTQTLGTWGGNFHVSEGLGFLYNDKFRVPRATPARFGATVPFSRIGTVIAPTLLFEGKGVDRRPFAALGAAGNAWIGAAVFQMATGLMEYGLGPQEAVELPRFLVGSRRSGGVRETVVQIEDGFAPDVLAELRAMGHHLQRISLRGELRMGYAAVAVIGDGEVRAGADPRRSGAAGAAR